MITTYEGIMRAKNFVINEGLITATMVDGVVTARDFLINPAVKSVTFNEDGTVTARDFIKS